MDKYNLAAIDIGTNSFHLIIAEIKPTSNFEIIDREKDVIRLGEGSGGDIKKITPEAMTRAVETLKRFKGLADSHNASIRAVATSAVRESLNKREFVDLVLEETGIEIEVISGIEEARIIYLGALKAVPIYDSKALCIDIGGGSTEFVVGHKGEILFSRSLKLGAVRLTQKFFPDFKVTKQRVAEARDWIEGGIFHVVNEAKQIGFDITVGSSGTFLSTANMISNARNGSGSLLTINNFLFTGREVSKLEKEILSRKTPEERNKISGLDAKRADIIPAGILIISSIIKEFGIKQMIVSDYALREGIVIDTIQKVKPEIGGSKLASIRKESVQQLMNSCDYSKDHCVHVAELSAKLFDQLQELHQLDSNAKEYLEAAAKLHDIGYHISHSQHHRHTQYIINNSELLGFNENEISIIANVARYHRKSHPKKSHKEYSSLTEKSKEIVNKLSAILRVADSLDRTHNSKVFDFKTEISENEVDILINYKGEKPEIEMWNFGRRKSLFESVFNKKINLVLN